MDTTTTNQTERPMVRMGEIHVARAPVTLTAVLGSCVGVCVFQPATQCGAMAHVVLPKSGPHAMTPGRFADTAIPEIVAMIRRTTGANSGFVAKLAGGANMFDSTGPLQIGQENCVAIRNALDLAAIPIVAEQVGGTEGRRARFSCIDGGLAIATAGLPELTI